MTDSATKINYDGLTYWAVRKAIEEAARKGNDRGLKALEELHPTIFQQMASQASKAMRGSPKMKARA